MALQALIERRGGGEGDQGGEPVTPGANSKRETEGRRQAAGAGEVFLFREEGIKTSGTGPSAWLSRN